MGWRDLTASSRQAMADHASNNPGCADGEVTARTWRDNRTEPPTVSQHVSCGTCEETLR